MCGPEASKAANHIFTSRMNREINRTVYTCMLNRGGGVEGDCTVTGLESGKGGIVDPIFKGKGFYIGIITNLNRYRAVLKSSIINSSIVGLVSGGMSSYHTRTHINKIIREKGFNVSLHDVTDQIGILSVQGPNRYRD